MTTKKTTNVVSFDIAKLFSGRLADKTRQDKTRQDKTRQDKVTISPKFS
ncbi:MAG: hypothetical protein LBU68_00215 [Rickettsiales bacterium]|jgi:hypothetical protein|nr:hypothetical protein [Rickettsiales bacterium]